MNYRTIAPLAHDLPQRRAWPTLCVLSTAIALVFVLFLTLTWSSRTALATGAPVAPALPTGGAGIQLFAANLAGAHEIPAIDTIASGRALLSLDGDTLHYRLFIADIDNVSAAHIHDGVVGVNGPVVFPLFNGTGLFDANNPISGTLTLTPTQVTKLTAGEYYINVHTTDVPSGEIRGQIEPFTPPANLNALLLGSNEIPAVTSEAIGVATFHLTNTNTLQYHVAVSEIMSITAAHIHLGPAAENGPVAHGLFTGTGTFDPDNPISGTVTLNAKDLVDLLTNYLYVNVHTAATPSGEIRGQIGGARLFEAALSGAEETPPVIGHASGRALLALTADAGTLAYRIQVEEIDDISAAHIHLGAAGVAGPVVLPLYSGSGAFDPTHPLSGTLALTTDQVMRLIAGDYYVNIHTPSHPSGEIRGQIAPFVAPMHLLALLRGNAEVPAVETDAVGIARLTLQPALGSLHFSVAVTDITGIGASHIHLGPAGQNGGVIFGLYNSSGSLAFDADHPIAGAVIPAAKDWIDLLTGYHYINVHTATHAGGEIRGQIGGPQLFRSTLSGANEVPTVPTDATGEGILALNRTATALDYRVHVADITDITASHIHRGAPGTDGGVVVALYTGAGSFDVFNPISGTVALATTALFDLLQGNHYINVHTASHPGGEIRGQIEPYTPMLQYQVPLSGTQEVPPVAGNASGGAFFQLDPTVGTLSYAISVTNIVSATAAHIHLAPVGENGGVVFGLYSAASGSTLDGTNPLGGLIHLNSKNLVDLLSGYYYVNIHTVANPSGEIRGQIHPEGGGAGSGPARRLYLPIIRR